MLKKILIGILIVVVLAGSAAFYAFKKIEAQFESFIMAEVVRQQATIEKELKAKMEAVALEAEKAAEIVEERLEAERVVKIINSYFENERKDNPENRQVYIGTFESVDANTESIEVVSNNDNISNNNQTSESSNQVVTNTPEEIKSEVVSVVDTSTEVIPVTEVEPVPVVVPAPVEVYTEEDFERDKKVAMNLAMSRLTASQISRLIDISGGGFSPEERVEAKEMFYSNFTEEEQNWILDIYTKYYYLASEG